MDLRIEYIDNNGKTDILDVCVPKATDIFDAIIEIDSNGLYRMDSDGNSVQIAYEKVVGITLSG